MIVREHTDADLDAIDRIHREAFDTPAEASLVRALIGSGLARVSLVAEVDGILAGHVLFSPVRIEEMPEIGGGLGLAPLAVLPSLHRRGVGSVLAHAGLERAITDGYDFAVVLGAPAYYARFGFAPASSAGLRCVYTDGDEFMCIALQPRGLSSVKGLVRYAPQFDAFEEWLVPRGQGVLDLLPGTLPVSVFGIATARMCARQEPMREQEGSG